MRIGDAIVTLLIIAFLVCYLVFLGTSSAIFIELIDSNHEEISKTDVAVVSELSYTSGRTVLIWNGKVAVPMPISEKYNIYLMYKEEKYCINDEIHFNKLKEGDSVEIIVHEMRNSKGEVTNKYLTFPEQNKTAE